MYNELSDEIKQKLGECKTQEEMRKVLALAGIEPLDDELLEAAAGGWDYINREFEYKRLDKAPEAPEQYIPQKRMI